MTTTHDNFINGQWVAGSLLGPRAQGKYAQEFFTTVKTAYTLA